MTAFDRSPEHYQALASAIADLRKARRGFRRYSSARLLDDATAYYGELVARGDLKQPPDLPNSDQIDYFVRKAESQLSPEHAVAMWDYIRIVHPRVLKAFGAYTDTHMVYSFYSVFGVKLDRLREFSSIVAGDYYIYHFSERFHKWDDKIQRAVVVGRLTINEIKNDIIGASERQVFDGARLPQRPMTENSAGFCIQKFRSLMVILKIDDRETPKTYIFDDIVIGRDDSTGKNVVNELYGHMVQLVDRRGSFRTGAYAERISTAGEAIPFNIYTCDDKLIRSSVIAALEKWSDNA